MKIVLPPNQKLTVTFQDAECVLEVIQNTKDGCITVHSDLIGLAYQENLEEAWDPQTQKDVENSLIEDFTFHPRLLRIAKDTGITTVKELTETSRRWLKQQPYIGEGIVRSTETILRKFGLQMKD